VQQVDVVVVGGGPAGSACAGGLVAAGLDVLVVDRARFPRDKPCAGWITPEVVEATAMDLAAYADGRTLQPIRRFRVGRVGGPARDVEYGEPVSFGILRREFDAWLLERSGARSCVMNVASLQRSGGRWRVNDAVEAPFLVGAGGHFCPVARRLKGSAAAPGAVVAQEMEIRLTEEQWARCRVAGDRPELDFTSDLDGYGWCFRKGEFLNVGLGRRDAPALASEVRAYLDWLRACGRIPPDLPAPLRGHAYRLREGAPPRIAGEGVLLAGDAAELAHAASGEGILPAIVSGQVAAEVVRDAARGVANAFESYPARLAARVGPRSAWAPPGALRALAGRAVLASSWLTKRVVLDRLFLHRGARAPVAS